MEIELWSGSTKAIVDPLGAWITNLSDDRGDVLFPKRSFKAVDGAVKTRGGCHVCLPNFGPGGPANQPQHGFGRELMWKVREQNGNSATLELEKGSGDYESLSSMLTYSLDGASLKLRLEVMNRGETMLRVAPGFHPYFALVGSKEVIINDEEQSLDELSEAQFETSDTMRLQVASRSFMLRSHNLSTWAKWTDRLGSYVCVEPTVGGFTFLESEPSSEELLAPGGRKEYSLEIAW